MKSIFKYGLILLFGLGLQSQTIEKSTIDSGGASVVNGLEVLYTIGQVNVNEVTLGNLSISEGFINGDLTVCNLTLSQLPQNLELTFDGSSNTDAVNTWLNNNGNAIVSSSCGNVTWEYQIIDDFLEDTNSDFVDDRLTIEIEFVAIDDESAIVNNAFIIFNDFATAGESAGNGGTICENTFPVSDFDNDLFTPPNEGVNYTDAKFDSSIFEIFQTTGAPGLELIDGGTVVNFPDTGAGQFTYNFDFTVETTVTIGTELPRFYRTATFYTANNVTVAFDPGPNITIPICDFNNVNLLELYNQLEIVLDVDTTEFNEAEDFGNVFEPENSWYNENDDLEANPDTPPLTEITAPGVYQFNAKKFLEDCAGEPVFVTLVADQVINEEAQDLTVLYNPNGNNVEIDAWLANNGGAIATDCEDITWDWALISSQLNQNFGGDPDDTNFVCTIEFKVMDVNQNQVGSSTAELKFEQFPSADDNIGVGENLCGITSYDLNQLSNPNYNDVKFSTSNFIVTQTSGFPGVTSAGTVVTFPDTGAGQFSYGFDVSITTPVNIGSTLTVNSQSAAQFSINEHIIPFDPGPNITVQVCDFNTIDLLDLYNQLDIQIDVDTTEYNDAVDLEYVFEPENFWYNETDDLEANPNTPPLTEITAPGVYQFNAKKYLQDCAGEPVFVTLSQEPLPNAGNSDTFFEDCFGFDTIDLNAFLSINADPNGLWESIDGLTIINNRDVDFPDTGAGQFTYGFIYRVQNNCGEEDDATIDIEINIAETVSAGDSFQDISVGPSNVDLDIYLSTNATLGGLWSGDLSVNAEDGTVDFPDTGAGQFFYSFIYTVENDCGQSDISTFDFIVDIPDDAGDNGILEICPGGIFTETDLFNALNGTPQSGGNWSPSINGPGIYTYTVNAAGGDSATVTVTEINCPISLNLRVYLQGPYDIISGLMIDNLRDTGLISTSSPYVDGLTCQSSVFNVTGSDAVVDWVWLELRDENDSSVALYSRSALIKRDGFIVDVDGVSAVNMNLLEGNYFVVVSHRNHIGILSAQAETFFYSATTHLDYTTNIAKIFGGSNAVTVMNDNKLSLFAGDYNGDGQVQNIDKLEVEELRGISGYSDADIDLNGQVQNTDINIFINPNLGKGQQFLQRMLYAKRRVE